MTLAANSSAEKPDGHSPGATSASFLDRLRTGDADAWERLDSLYAPLVCWWCWQRRVHEQDAGHIVQEVFLTVHARVADFQRERTGSFRAWLRTITENKIGDRRRREHKQAQAAGGSTARQFLENMPAESSAVEESQDEREIVILVRQAWELVQCWFEPRTCQAAWRVVVDQQFPSEVAGELGMSVGAVRTAKSRVLAKLRAVFGDLLDEEGITSA